MEVRRGWLSKPAPSLAGAGDWSASTPAVSENARAHGSAHSGEARCSSVSVKSTVAPAFWKTSGSPSVPAASCEASAVSAAPIRRCG